MEEVSFDLGAAEEEKEKEGPAVGMGSIFRVHRLDLRHIALFVIFP